MAMALFLERRSGAHPDHGPGGTHPFPDHHAGHQATTRADQASLRVENVVYAVCREFKKETRMGAILEQVKRDAEVIHGDCLEVLQAMPDCSVDAIIGDPP